MSLSIAAFAGIAGVAAGSDSNNTGALDEDDRVAYRRLARAARTSFRSLSWRFERGDARVGKAAVLVEDLDPAQVRLEGALIEDGVSARLQPLDRPEFLPVDSGAGEQG